MFNMIAAIILLYPSLGHLFSICPFGSLCHSLFLTFFWINLVFLWFHSISLLCLEATPLCFVILMVCFSIYYSPPSSDTIAFLHTVYEPNNNVLSFPLGFVLLMSCLLLICMLLNPSYITI